MEVFAGRHPGIDGGAFTLVDHRIDVAHQKAVHAGVAGGQETPGQALPQGLACGLGQQLDVSMKMFNGGEVATMLLVFIALVALADRVSAGLRRGLG